MAMQQHHVDIYSPSKQAAITLIRNIYQYSQILNQAASEKITEWNATSVRNAVHWALYCEEIHKQVEGKEFEESLKSQLNQLTFLMRPASCRLFSVSSLQSATALLTTTIMVNPHSTPFLRETLESCLTVAKGCTKEVWEKEKKQLESSRTSFFALQNVLSLLPTTKQKTDKILKQISLRCSSELLLESLSGVSKSTSNKDMFQKYCYSMCDRICAEAAGWDLLIYAACTGQNIQLLADELYFKQVIDHILSWMMETLKISPDICPIWNIDQEVLRKACQSNTAFTRFYILALDKWANLFQPSLDCTNKFHWRSPSQHTINDLKDHVQGLLLCEDSIGSSLLLDFIIEKQNSGFTIWQNVALGVCSNL